MISFRGVILTCIIVVHVTSGYGDLPAEMPPPFLPIPSECRDLMDLYFVLDGSDSISAIDFKLLKDAMASLLPQIRLGKTQSRIGMLVYSSDVPAESEHPFSADFNYLMQAATTLSYPRDGTHTDLGIKHMRHMFKRYGRRKVPWVAVVITDGISKNFRETKREADLAREMGISMFAVGVTKKINRAELIAIADTPKQAMELGAFQELRSRLSGMMMTICPCPAPPVLSFAECGSGPRAIGSVRTYSCKVGYLRRGNADIHCREDSTWSPLDPNFECAPCGAPPPISHAHCDGNDHLIGAKRVCSCDSRYAMIGDPNIECLSDATWSPYKFSCSPCGKTPDVPLAKCNGGGDLVGDRRDYSCDPRYALIGDPFIECTTNGQWTRPHFTCEPCGLTPPIQHGRCGGGDNFVGSKRKYHCNKGYALLGDPFIRCLPNGQWSDLHVSCSLCGNTPPIDHGRCGGGEHFVDSVRQYQCDTGYALIGDPYIKCLPNGQWSDLHVSCSLCGNTPPIDHGRCGGGEHFVDSVRQYQCEAGYAMIGDPNIRCLSNGQWSKVKVSCSLCGNTPPIDHGRCGGGDHFVDSVRQYQCEAGYALIGDPYIKCLPNGQWSDLHVSCSLCGNTPPIDHGRCEGGEHFVDSVRQYQCEAGYAMIGDPNIRCLSNGQWSKVKVSCSLCGNTPPIDHGRCGGGDHFVDSVRQYQCEAGYALIGDPYIKCLPNGQWSDLHVSCSLCGNTPPIDHGRCGGGEHFVDSVRQYQCDTGYALIGDPYIKCLPNGQWSDLHVSCSLCGNTPPIDHGRCGGGDHFVDSVRQYHCEAGYAMIGDPNIRCLSNGQWSKVKVSCSLCGNTPPIDHGRCGGGDHFVDSVRQYQCEAGYAMIGDPNIRCLSNGQWSKVKVSCSLCGNTPPIDHGRCGGGDHFVDSVRQYHCEAGYAMIGDPNIRCLSNGQWSKVKVSCSLCGKTPPIDHGRCGGGDHFVDSVRQYQCEAGYALIGDPYIKCLPNGQWSDLHVSCSLCGNTPPIDHGRCGVGDHFVDSVRQYQCEAGYAMIGDPKIRCLSNGQWSKVKVSCSLCGNTPPIDHGRCGGGDHFVDSVRQYQCEAGYAMIGDPNIRCLPNGQWSDLKVSCSLCGKTPPIDHGRCGGGDHFVDSVRQYQCEAGYAMIGDPNIRCLSNGQWSKVKVSCSLCGNTPPIDHGRCGGGEHFVDSVRQYQCEAGYAMIGDPNIRCLSNGQWSKVKVTCSLCGKTPPIDHGRCGVGDHFVDSVRQYQCETGYAMIGDPNIRCLPNGQWSDLKVSCSLCGKTPPMQHGRCGGGDNFVNSLRQYECEAGYALIGDPFITCLPNGLWSDPQMSCSLCENPPSLDHGQCLSGDRFVDSVRKYECDLGYALVGDPFIRCLPNGQWSDSRPSCLLSCGNTPPVDHGTCSGVDHIVDSVRHYVCEKGYAMIGDPMIKCQPDGRWSDVQVTCRLCDEPPQISHAACSSGGRFVGDKRRYHCEEGYEAWGGAYTECLPDGTWSRADFRCKARECGALPHVPNAYPRMGPSHIGAQRDYYCDIGYQLRGYSRTVCQRNGLWKKPSFSCDIMTTQRPTTPKPIPADPSACDECRLANGVGYNRHPYDCSQFVQCYLGLNGMESVYRKCPFGLFWDQDVLTCRQSYHVHCPTDRCRNKGVHGYKTERDPSNCCSYWKCDNGVSRADCCGMGKTFNPKTGHCERDNSCTAPCLHEEIMPGCDKRPNAERTKFEQHTGRGSWAVMHCAPGTGFNPVTCRCSDTLKTAHITIPGQRKQVCKPTVYLPFHTDHRDNSGSHVYIENHNVTIVGGSAYFDGNARLMIPQFTNRKFKGHLVIKFRYKEIIDEDFDNIQTLVSNGDCGSDPSIIISKIPEYVIMASKTRKLRTLAVATMNKEWKEVVFMHDESYLEGSVCGASTSTSSAGPIKATQCSLQVGHGQGMHRFKGYIDDFTIYQCRPDRLMTVVY